MTTTPPEKPSEEEPPPTPTEPPPTPPAQFPESPDGSETPRAPQYPPPPPLPPEGYPAYQGGPGYEYGQYGAPPVRPRNGMGVAALVLGLVGFLIGPCSILAIVFGRIGLQRAARGEATNRGVAQAGFVLGIITLVLWILGLIVLANR